MFFTFYYVMLIVYLADFRFDLTTFKKLSNRVLGTKQNPGLNAGAIIKSMIVYLTNLLPF